MRFGRDASHEAREKIRSGSSGARVDPMLELLSFISYIITLYTYVVIASVILSWLLAFNVINGYNQIGRAHV